MRDDRYAHYDDWEARERSPIRSEFSTTAAAAARTMPHNRGRVRRASDECAMPRRGVPATAATRIGRRRSKPTRDQEEQHKYEAELVQQHQDEEEQQVDEMPTLSRPTQAQAASHPYQMPDVIQKEINSLLHTEEKLNELLTKNSKEREYLMEKITQVQKERKNYIYRYCPKAP